MCRWSNINVYAKLKLAQMAGMRWDQKEREREQERESDLIQSTSLGERCKTLMRLGNDGIKWSIMHT